MTLLPALRKREEIWWIFLFPYSVTRDFDVFKFLTRRLLQRIQRVSGLKLLQRKSSKDAREANDRVVLAKFNPITADQRKEIYFRVFIRALARPLESKQMLMLRCCRKNLKEFIVPANTILSFPANTAILLLQGLSCSTFNVEPSIHRMNVLKKYNQFMNSNNKDSIDTIERYVGNTFSTFNRRISR